MDKKVKVIKSKCLADALVWIGFEYEKTEEGYVFERDWRFDYAFGQMHSLKNYCKK